MLGISNEIGFVLEKVREKDEATDASLVVLEKNTGIKLPQSQVHRGRDSGRTYSPLKCTWDEG